MKTLTIKQPYASLIKEGMKEYEFRTWKTKYRGDILIHAGKNFDKSVLDKFKKYDIEYPSSCIIAKATLTECIEVTDEFRKILNKINPVVYEKIINDKDWKGYAFKLENIEPIEYINAKGKLSFWEYNYK